MKNSVRVYVPFMIIFASIVFAGLVVYFIEELEKDRGVPKLVLEALPDDPVSLKVLAEKLVEYDRAALKKIKLERGEDPRLPDAKKDYPEHFVVPAEWLALVVQSREISDVQVKRLLDKVREEPLLTTGAAFWVLEVSQELRAEGAYEEQKRGINALCGDDRSEGLRSGSATKEQKRGVDVLCALDKPPVEEGAARQVAEKAVASMFIDLKLTSKTQETASFEVVVAGKKCDVEVANNVSSEPGRWLVTGLNCER